MDNNKIVSSKRTSAIFLASVLIAGTIATISSQSSFMINAQAQTSYYDDGRMDSRYNSYGPTSEYPSGYTDRNSYYNSYGPTSEYPSGYTDRNSYYNSYGPTTDYGNDNYYESQYQLSPELDYKPQYPSYGGKDDSYKSTKDSNSKKIINLNKIKCINDNININGDNTGDFNSSNKGKVEPPTSSFSNYGEINNNSGYNNKDFECIIDNNNKQEEISTTVNNTTINNLALKCENCIEYYLNFVIDRIHVNTVLDAIRTALDLPIQGDIFPTPTLDLTMGADLFEICDAIEERLNTSITDNDAIILGNILQAALDALPNPLPGSPPTPHPLPDPFYNNDAIVKAIFDCIAEQLNLVIP